MSRQSNKGSGFLIVPYELKEGKKPDGARLIRPHANESVLVFTRLLAEKLTSEKIPNDEKAIEGIMQRGQPLRLANSDGQFKNYTAGELRHAATNVLTIEDYLCRARLVEDSLSDGKNIFVLELHAMNPNGSFEIDEAMLYRSLNNTGMLVTSFSEALNHSFGIVSSSLLKPTNRFMEFVELHEKIAKLRNFDFWEAKKELEELKKALSWSVHVAKLVEIPGVSKAISKENLLYPFYFDSPNPADAKVPLGIGEFEINYCATFRKVVENDAKSIQAVASIVRLPPNGNAFSP
jgi:hypothetical protein